MIITEIGNRVFLHACMHQHTHTHTQNLHTHTWWASSWIVSTAFSERCICIWNNKTVIINVQYFVSEYYQHQNFRQAMDNLSIIQLKVVLGSKSSSAATKFTTVTIISCTNQTNLDRVNRSMIMELELLHVLQLLQHLFHFLTKPADLMLLLFLVSRQLHHSKQSSSFLPYFHCCCLLLQTRVEF